MISRVEATAREVGAGRGGEINIVLDRSRGKYNEGTVSAALSVIRRRTCLLVSEPSALSAPFFC